jgi:hypothetical protein
MGRGSIGANGHPVLNRRAVRMSEPELATLLAAADQLGLPLSRYLVLAALQVARAELRVRVTVPTKLTPGPQGREAFTPSAVPPKLLIVFDDAGHEQEAHTLASHSELDLPVGAVIAMSDPDWGAYLVGHVTPGGLRMSAGWVAGSDALAREVRSRARRARGGR